jgi:hypothetical protein
MKSGKMIFSKGVRRHRRPGKVNAEKTEQSRAKARKKRKKK